MNDLLSNITGGFLAAVVFAAASALFVWGRRPYFIPLNNQLWTADTRTRLARAGYPDPSSLSLPMSYQLHEYEAQGYRRVLVGRWPFRREVRSELRDGYAILMTKPK